MKPHKHHQLMLEYAKDAAETETPWERWERASRHTGQWHTIQDHPAWHDGAQYRRKPKTIKINGYDVPEPCREALADGDSYWTPDFTETGDVYEVEWWGNSVFDQRSLKAGLVHLTREAAEQHAKALLSFTRKEGEQP